MSAQGPQESSHVVDALIVGAGPTGLTLAAQRRLHGVRFRIIDRLVDRSRESRALAVQARTLEIFQALGIAETLVSRGNTSARLVLHFSERGVVEVRLGDVNATDTRFPTDQALSRGADLPGGRCRAHSQPSRGAGHEHGDPRCVESRVEDCTRGARSSYAYEAERWPVGRFLLRVTDRVFTRVARATSVGTFSAWVRRTIVPRVLPRVVASKRLRNVAFRFVSELDIRYRSSPIVREGEPRLSGGPRAGDRLPDAPITHDGTALSLHQALTGGSMHLLLCGGSRWDEETSAELVRRSAGLLKVHRLTPVKQQPTTGVLIDHTGIAYQRLAVRDAAQYLIRPDGYIRGSCASSRAVRHEGRQALRLLTKAEQTCLVTNSLKATPHLEAVIEVDASSA